MEWPLARPFTIARGSRKSARVIQVELTDDAGHTGRGEAVPYPRLNETPEQALADLEQARAPIEAGAHARDLPRLLRTKAARNALDCALWDLHAKRESTPVWRLAALPAPAPVITACTISLAAPADMAAEARERAGFALLKLKLGGAAQDDIARLEAVRAAAPGARLVVDANEGWRAPDLPRLLDACAACGVELVEQPLPEGEDAALARMEHPVAICADESVRAAEDLSALSDRYDAINIKLDKAGGLTPAIALARAARARNMPFMVGCMLASSLAMAPAFALAPWARWVDLDGPLLLAEDATPPIRFDGPLMHPPDPALWG